MTAREWIPPRLVSGHRFVDVTARQAQVLDGLCRGLTLGAQARALGISQQAVNKRLRHLCNALGVASRTHAVALACSEQVTVIVRGSSR